MGEARTPEKRPAHGPDSSNAERRAADRRIFPEHAAAIARIMRELTPAEQEELRRIAGKLGRGAEELCAERLKKEIHHDSHPTK